MEGGEGRGGEGGGTEGGEGRGRRGEGGGTEGGEERGRGGEGGGTEGGGGVVSTHVACSFVCALRGSGSRPEWSESAGWWCHT